MNGKVTIYIFHLNNISLLKNDYLQKIPYPYLLKYEKTKNDKDKTTALASGYLLYKCLKVNKNIELLINEYGKPKLINSNINFNITHDGDFAILATCDSPVGIDIEPIQDVCWEVCIKYFSKEKIMQMKDLDAEKQKIAFTLEWTKLEAILKAEGIGFSMGIAGYLQCRDNWYTRSIIYHDHIITYATSKETDFELVLV